MQRKKIIIGVDATNIKSGGGKTHINELLFEINPERHAVKRIVVWASIELLKEIPDSEWIQKETNEYINSGIYKRLYWQMYRLDLELRQKNCDVLFVPGGFSLNKYSPMVSVCQNMLPFENKELFRYGISMVTIRLLLLRLFQEKTFKRSAGIIFLSEYAYAGVQKKIGPITSMVSIVPHGIKQKFFSNPRPQRHISEYSNIKPLKIIYVSIVDVYKHQWNLVKAAFYLRKKMMWPIKLELIGPAYKKSYERLKRYIKKYDENNEWIEYYGQISHQKLNEYYKGADIAVFASTCENMPNILIEMMASGLPIACSYRGPMPEILGNSGVYFNPECYLSIYDAISELIKSPEKRSQLAFESYEKAKKYSWSDCADKTMSLISDIIK